uniref:beta-1,3-galactosyltransferase 5-like isoform X1 n=1 Tax=Styela clava TaxID=7725 RepID=UPI0019393C48|nr:beta-1,3-galactosyltransferase 5-like isoform X1 [Styela clava]
MTSFKQFGLEEISLLKRMDTQRPLFNILMEPWKMLCTNNTKNLTDSRWSMIVAVKTGYDRIVQRDRIRKTWPSNTFLNGVCLYVIFVVANTTTAEENFNLRKEESVHGDILQVELEETYRNIGLKALASMQWTADNFPSNWIYSSADDDMLPDFHRLYENIEKLMSEEKSFTKNSSNLFRIISQTQKIYQYFAHLPTTLSQNQNDLKINGRSAWKTIRMTIIHRIVLADFIQCQ